MIRYLQNKKKSLRRYNRHFKRKNVLRFAPFRSGCLTTFQKSRSSHARCFTKKLFLKISQYSQGKKLCWNLFLIQSIKKFLWAPILRNICKRFLLKIKNCWSGIFNCLFFQHQYQRQVKMYVSLFIYYDWFLSEFVFTYNISLRWWEINSKQWICIKVNQKKIKVQGKKILCEHALNFDK